MEEDKREKKYKFKACPFRTGHFCGSCELLMPGINMCVFKCLNSNLGLLVKTLIGDKETAEKIKDELYGTKTKDKE